MHKFIQSECSLLQNLIWYRPIDQRMIGSEEDVLKAVDRKSTVADDNFMEVTQIVSPNRPLSEREDDV